MQCELGGAKASEDPPEALPGVRKTEAGQGAPGTSAASTGLVPRQCGAVIHQVEARACQANTSSNKQQNSKAD